MGVGRDQNLVCVWGGCYLLGVVVGAQEGLIALPQELAQLTLLFHPHLGQQVESGAASNTCSMSLPAPVRPPHSPE